MQDDVHAGRISDAQLETVAYSLQRFYGERLEGGARGGFFLGDGAGVGKGRQIAAVIKAMWENRGHKTRRILWLSHNKDLREDARRDMMDLHINVPSASKRSAVARPRIDVWPRGNQSFPQKSRAIKEYLKEGVVFATYDLLKAGTKGVRKECTTIRGKCAPSPHSTSHHDPNPSTRAARGTQGTWSALSGVRGDAGTRRTRRTTQW